MDPEPEHWELEHWGLGHWGLGDMGDWGAWANGQVGELSDRNSTPRAGTLTGP